MPSVDQLDNMESDSTYSAPSAAAESNYTLSYSEMGTRYLTHVLGAGGPYSSTGHSQAWTGSSGVPTESDYPSTIGASTRSEDWTDDEVSMAEIRLAKKNKLIKKEALLIVSYLVKRFS